MSIPALCSLDVSGIAAASAHLYLWTTNSFIEEAHEISRAWGFQPKTVLTWGKTKDDGSPSMKTGFYFRGATEHVLFGVRGSLKLSDKNARPTLFLSRRLAHSRKPDWFYQIAEECTPGPRLEMFAREKRLGWHSWGNEVPCDIDIRNKVLEESSTQP